MGSCCAGERKESKEEKQREITESTNVIEQTLQGDKSPRITSKLQKEINNITPPHFVEDNVGSDEKKAEAEKKAATEK